VPEAELPRELTAKDSLPAQPIDFSGHGAPLLTLRKHNTTVTIRWFGQTIRCALHPSCADPSALTSECLRRTGGYSSARFITGATSLRRRRPCTPHQPPSRRSGQRG
jgi:hypothetical protein